MLHSREWHRPTLWGPTQPGPYQPVLLECSEILLNTCQKSRKFLFLYCTSFTRGIGVIDVAPYSIANGAEKYNLNATRCDSSLVHGLVWPALKSTIRTADYPKTMPFWCSVVHSWKWRLKFLLYKIHNTLQDLTCAGSCFTTDVARGVNAIARLEMLLAHLKGALHNRYVLVLSLFCIYSYRAS